MAERKIAESRIAHEVWRTGMQMRNRLFTWKDHPTFDNKTSLRACAMRVIGAQELCASLTISLPREQLVKTMDLYALLGESGHDAKYRQACFETALAAFPYGPTSD